MNSSIGATRVTGTAVDTGVVLVRLLVQTLVELLGSLSGAWEAPETIAVTASSERSENKLATVFLNLWDDSEKRRAVGENRHANIAWLVTRPHPRLGCPGMGRELSVIDDFTLVAKKSSDGRPHSWNSVRNIDGCSCHSVGVGAYHDRLSAQTFNLPGMCCAYTKICFMHKVE